jgi:hypothetical protein
MVVSMVCMGQMNKVGYYMIYQIFILLCVLSI